jgi:secondary thiamine-phosphate synthase enzyme
MKWFKGTLNFTTQRRGLFDITREINQQIRDWGVEEGMLYLFMQHTSASLVINENYDSSAKGDMERYFDHIAPEGESWYRHTLEGSDDSPAHLRTMITQTSLTIPVDNGKLSLGTWQGIFLAEHRQNGHQRKILLRVLSTHKS